MSIRFDKCWVTQGCSQYKALNFIFAAFNMLEKKTPNKTIWQYVHIVDYPALGLTLNFLTFLILVHLKLKKKKTACILEHLIQCIICVQPSPTFCQYQLWSPEQCSSSELATQTLWFTLCICEIIFVRKCQILMEKRHLPAK